MTCEKCGSGKVTVGTVGNVSSRGGTVPMWYWLSVICPFIDLALMCCVIGFFGITIHHALKRSAKKTETRVDAYAVCQDCGFRWKV